MWKSDPEHEKIISNALGWLKVAETMQPHVAELVAFAEEIRKADFEYAVVLGMGGSSLCPEVLGRTFAKKDGYPQLYVLDSTVPTAIRHLEQKIKSATRCSSCRRSRATPPSRRCFTAISTTG